MDDVAVITGMRSRRRCGSPCHGAQTPSDQSSYASAMPAAGNSADYSPSAGAEQAAAERTLGGIIGVRRGRRRQQQPGTDHAS
jgi:hypothetical protein